MRSSRVWRGVRMRDVAAGSDPDAPPRSLTLPAAWEDAAAEALAALVPGDSRANLPEAAGTWISPIAARARLTGDAGLGDRLHALLLLRRAAPTAALWTGEAAAPLGYLLNLPAFCDTEAGFDVEAFADTVDTVAAALRLSDPGAPRFAIAMTDLDGLLAALGLDYDSDQARDVARCLAALMRARADIALAGNQPDLLSALPSWPVPPPYCSVPGLAEAAALARAAVCRGACAQPSTAILPPGPADALLGAETGGIAPAFSPVRPDGSLSRAALARLAAHGLTPEAALAGLLRGSTLLAPAPVAAHAAMHRAVAPFCHAMPVPPISVPGPATPALPRRGLPERPRSFIVKAGIGGHRVFLRMTEFDDGSLAAVHLTLPRESAGVRALVDAVCAAVSLGLQHGVALAEYVDAYLLTRFPPSGLVEGDPLVGNASSVLDWMARRLAHRYLGECDAPEAEPDAPRTPANDPTPLLPMDLPAYPRNRRPDLPLAANQ